MADLPFGQQLILSVTQGVVAAAIVVWAGSRFFRRQEQARNEEAAKAEQARIQRNLISETAAALGDQVDAKMELVSLSNWKEVPQEELMDASTRAHSASRRFWSVMLRNQLQVPPDAIDVLLQANTDVDSATTQEEINKAISALATGLAPIFQALLKGPLDFVPHPAPAAPASTANTGRGPSSP